MTDYKKGMIQNIYMSVYSIGNIKQKHLIHSTKKSKLLELEEELTYRQKPIDIPNFFSKGWIF